MFDFGVASMHKTVSCCLGLRVMYHRILVL